MNTLHAVLVALPALVACGASTPPSLDAGLDAEVDAPSPFATRVVSFEAGAGAGYGQARLPDVVLGPPIGGGDSMGGTDVLSLGAGGRICLGFDVVIVDGPGPDFIVFENPFLRAGTETVFDELGEVSVSDDDGATFHAFHCDPAAGPPSWPGCAGWQPVYSTPSNGISATDPALAGGDAFDLADVGVARASIVCVRDLATRPVSPPSTGFDLDAIAAIHSTPGP